MLIYIYYDECLFVCVFVTKNEPHRGGQADVIGDHGDICDHDDRDTIRFF